MADTKGIVIEFKGDTISFDKSLDGVNRGLKTLKNEMSQINKQLKLDPSNVDLLKSKFSNLKEQQKVVKEQVSLYKKELSELSQEEIGSKKWVELQKKLGDAEVELQKLNKEVDKFKNTNFGLVAFGNQLEDASKKTQKLANELKGLSRAGQIVGASLVATTINAGKQADEINTLAKQYNLTTEQIQQFQMASDLIDTDLSTITKAYAKLTKNMTSNSKDVQEAFKTLGVETKDANGELRDSNDVFNELIDALGKVENETQQDNLAMQVFGKSANELGPLINGGAEKLQEFNKYLEENNLLLSQDELDSLNNMNDAFDMIKATLKAFGQKIATDYAPMLQQAFEKISNVILKLRKYWEKLNPTIKKIIPIASGVIGGLSPALSLFSKLQGGLGGLIKSFGMGGGGLGGILSKLTSPIGIAIALFGTLYATNEEFREAINKLVKTFIDNLKPILETIIARLSDLFDKISTFIMPILNKIAGFIVQYIIPPLSKLIEAVMPVLETSLDVIFDILEWIVNVMSDLFDFLEEIGVIDAFREAFEKVGEIIDKVAGWIKKTYDWFVNLIAKAKEYLGIQGEIERHEYATYTNRNGNYTRGGGGTFSGGYGDIASGGFTLNTNITINNPTSQITQAQVMSWADIMTNRINDNLGRLM